MTRWATLLLLALLPASATGQQLDVLASSSRGSAWLSVEKPTKAHKLPPLRNVWNWPPSLARRGSDLAPDSIFCSLLAVRPGGIDVANLALHYLIELKRGDDVVFSTGGEGSTTATGFFVSVPLNELELGKVETAEAVIVFDGKKKVTFTRMDCHATLGPQG